MKKKIILGIVLVVVIMIVVQWPKTVKEQEEAKNLPIENIDFTTLSDGTYIGEYEGGMYKWRVNKVEVTVKNGKVTDIKLIDPKVIGDTHLKLYDRVINEQSLDVDVISGATLTSKSYLKAIEIALKKAK